MDDGEYVWCAQEEYEASLKDCNKAIKLNEKYVKAYLRRATANEKLDKLEDALQGKKQYAIALKTHNYIIELVIMQITKKYWS